MPIGQLRPFFRSNAADFHAVVLHQGRRLKRVASPKDRTVKKLQVVQQDRDGGGGGGRRLSALVRCGERIRIRKSYISSEHSRQLGALLKPDGNPDTPAEDGVVGGEVMESLTALNHQNLSFRIQQKMQYQKFRIHKTNNGKHSWRNNSDHEPKPKGRSNRTSLGRSVPPQ